MPHRGSTVDAPAVRVRCDRIISPASGEAVADHPGIRIGEEYPVLEILATGDQCRLRLPEHGYNGEDRDSPALWDAAMFTVVAERMPGCWGLISPTDS
ncbi:hypothetical protein Stsp01_18500 [Streptomyces sp. NBRC 13847]|nr:hypothetical protein Stsp01_18500 [Streptomyces sp. NBRC 13847]